MEIKICVGLKGDNVVHGRQKLEVSEIKAKLEV